MTSSNGNILRTFSALLAICAGNSPVTSEFPAQRPVTRSFDVLFDLRLNKRLSEQSWGWRLETPSCPLWRHNKDHRNTELCGLKSSNWNNLRKTIPYSDVLYDHYKFELGHLFPYCWHSSFAFFTKFRKHTMSSVSLSHMMTLCYCIPHLWGSDYAFEQATMCRDQYLSRMSLSLHHVIADRKCNCCIVIEDESHFLFICDMDMSEREYFFQKISRVYIHNLSWSIYLTLYKIMYAQMHSHYGMDVLCACVYICIYW